MSVNRRTTFTHHYRKLQEMRTKLARRSGIYKVQESLFKKGKLYKLMLGFRIAYILFVVTLWLFHYKTSSVHVETVNKIWIEEYATESNHQIHTHRIFHFRTEERNYAMNSKVHFPPIETGDRILIDCNFLGKDIYFSKPGWAYKYSTHSISSWTYLSVAITLISFWMSSFGGMSVVAAVCVNDLTEMLWYVFS